MTSTSNGLNVCLVGGSSVPYSNYSGTLENAAEFGSGWLDFALMDKYQISARASAVGMSLKIESRSDSSQTALETTTVYSESTFVLFTVICRERYMRFTWINTTGSQVTEASLTVKTFYGSSDKLSVFPVNVTPSSFSQAALVQSILRGIDANGTYQQVKVNTDGGLEVADPILEIIRGRTSNTVYYNKFGSCAGVSLGDAGDVFRTPNQEYSGTDVTTAATLDVVSTSLNDTGTTVTSGTATGGSTTTLVDTGKDFVTAGVAVGDMVVNTTTLVHGIITGVATTTLTVPRMCGGLPEVQSANSSGDSYFVVNANSTGAALVRVYRLLDGDYEGYSSEYVVMNGTTPVSTSGTYLRCSRAKVVLSGTADQNQGTITGEIGAVEMFGIKDDGSNQTRLLVDTVPAGKWLYIKNTMITMQRTNGSSGSMTAQFRIRPRGEVWTSIIFTDLTTSRGYASTVMKTIAIPPMADFKWSYSGVSDNTTAVSGEIAGILVTM